MPSHAQTYWPEPPVTVELWGPLACFTRPELKVERVSYPVMTPSAAIGALSAIFWKPEMQYVIQSIEVLTPIDWINIRRNEVKSVITAPRIKALRANHRERYDVEQDRDQRNTVALRDVAYRVNTQIVPTRSAKAPAAKYREQLRRRTERGGCFSQPFLGCREFSASFGPRGSWPGSPADSKAGPIERTEELGVMLHSIRYGDRGQETYHWFRASLDNGVLHVPRRPLGDDEVHMPAGSWRTGA
ncbi:type I-C CRISPR-associated protein Cas5c [Kitasatospora sp. NPDC058243]|uniref:type I-C CRISPR-associated protein Cas5c n=1 Tax=Kitasatospora sp. NPDC058243 TaxID=3346397 RepID=UPI0036DF3FB3